MKSILILRFSGPLLGIFLAVQGAQVQGAVINAASTAFVHVAAAVASAGDGDTVLIPAGTASWTSTLNYSKAITLKGAGVGLTIIKDSAPGPDNDNSGCINVTTVAGKVYRITDIEFQPGVRTLKLTKGVVSWRGLSHSVRLDHCKFTATYNRDLAVYDWVLGVADHCDFASNDAPLHIAHGSWGNGKDGDLSWSSANTLGTADAWYVEDCTFTPIGGASAGVMDAEFGARIVLRYCIIVNSHQEMHGTEGGQDRSTRQFEYYKNTITTPGAYAEVGQIRGGSGVIWGNTCIGPYEKFFTLNCYRSRQWYDTWGISDGRNPLDNNAPNGPFGSGTHQGGNNSSTMSDPAKTWSTSQWVGYTIRNTTTSRASNASPIESNNTNTITEWPAASQDGLMTFNTGDGYQFWKLVAALDMPGMGKDDGLNRTTMKWPNQTIEGVWSWDNTLNGSTANVTADKYPFIVQGTHFFNGTAKPNYTPYTYPHPLTSDGESPPDAPEHLKILPGP